MTIVRPQLPTLLPVLDRTPVVAAAPARRRRSRARVVATIQPLRPSAIGALDAVTRLGIPLRCAWDGRVLTVIAEDRR